VTGAEKRRARTGADTVLGDSAGGTEHAVETQRLMQSYEEHSAAHVEAINQQQEVTKLTQTTIQQTSCASFRIACCRVLGAPG